MRFVVLCTCWCCTPPQVVFSYLIVHIAVGEHGVEVLYTLKCLPVIFVPKTLLNSAQIHRICNNCIIILKDNKETGMNTTKSFFPRSQSKGTSPPRHSQLDAPNFEIKH